MPEGFKELLLDLLKEAEGSKSSSDLKSLEDRFNHLTSFYEHAKFAQEIGDRIFEPIISAALDFTKENNLDETEFLRYVVYGTVGGTIRFIEEGASSEEEETCPPSKPNPPDNAEKDEILAAIESLKSMLENGYVND